MKNWSISNQRRPCFLSPHTTCTTMPKLVMALYCQHISGENLGKGVDQVSTTNISSTLLLKRGKSPFWQDIALFASTAEINVFWKLFVRSSPEEGASGIRITLEVIVQPQKPTFEITLFARFSSLRDVGYPKLGFISGFGSSIEYLVVHGLKASWTNTVR